MKIRSKIRCIVSGVVAFTLLFPMGLYAEEVPEISDVSVIVENTEEILPEENADVYAGEDSFVEVQEDYYQENVSEWPEITEEYTPDMYYVEEPTLEDTEEPVETIFEAGYVLVPQGTVVYTFTDAQEEYGQFDFTSYAYAEVVERAENEADDWLVLKFDTIESRTAGTDILFAYAQYKDVYVLSEEEVTQLITDLGADAEVRAEEDIFIPAADFTLSAAFTPEAAEEEIVTEEAVAELEEITTEESAEAGTEGITITQQPADVDTVVGEQAIFSVVAEGDGLSYQWQLKTPSGTKFYNSGAAGNKTASIKVDATLARSGGEYRVIITDKNGTQVTSAAAKLTVTEPTITITQQPENADAVVGDKVTFSVVAEGEGLTYQWQLKTPGSSKFYNSGAVGNKTASIKVDATIARSGGEYRVIITDANGKSVTSEAARLTVTEAGAILITKQPEDVNAVVGDKITFSVAAEGEGLTYQWQLKTPSGTKFYNSGAVGNKTDTIHIDATLARSGGEYRVIITDKNGSSVTSSAAKLTVTEPSIVISSQPADVEAVVGDKVTFSVVAEGEGLTYQWQLKAPGSTKFGNSGATGNKTSSIKVDATMARSGGEYRVIIKDKNGASVTSKAAKLTVLESAPITITQQPADVEAVVGEKVTFTVAAEGEGLTYQWQLKGPGSTKFGNSGATGNKTTSIKVDATLARSGGEYRVVITDKAGHTVTSNAAKLTVTEEPSIVITKQPEDVEAFIGDKAVFSVAAEGDGLTYQWQLKAPGSTKFGNSGAAGNKTASISVDATIGRSGGEYRVVITDKDGHTVTSEAAKLTVTNQFTENDVRYELLNTGNQVKVVSWLGSAATVTIPETVREKTVMEIGEEAFMGNTTLESIDLPDTITVIRARAFKNCTNLKSMS